MTGCTRFTRASLTIYSLSHLSRLSGGNAIINSFKGANTRKKNDIRAMMIFVISVSKIKINCFTCTVEPVERPSP